MNETHTGLSARTVVVTSLLVCCLPAAAFAQPKPGSAYDQLPTDTLIKELSFLGMTDLLQGLDAEIPANDTSATALAARGRIRVALANAMENPEARNQLLDKAIPFYKQAVKLAEKNLKTDEDFLNLFRTYLELITAMGRYRPENPHVLRLRHLQGSEKDRKAIRLYTKEAVELADMLKDDIADKLTDWRPDMEKLMLLVPRLEDIEQALKYNAGWVRIYRAMALDKGAERDQLCRDAMAEMRPFTEDPASGVMYWALYLTGIAHRLLGQHDKADALFSQAAVPEANSGELRQRAWFERARNRIEQGDPDKARKAIEEFKTSALAVWGQRGKVMVDLRVVLLRNYFYEMQAAAQKDPAKADDLRRKAQDVLLSFVEDHADRPDLVKAFLDIIATKFADVEDLASASAIVVLAKAYAKVESEDAKEQAEAIKLLKSVLVHDDLKSPKIANSIRPGVLWELAFLMNKAKRNIEAGRCFVALTRLHPKNRLASRSAKFAVRSLYGLIQERSGKGELIKTNLRLEFIYALDALMGGWGAEEGIAKWNFDLASQCMSITELVERGAVKLYWQGRAIAAFEAVPAELLEYMEAQHSALGLRTEIVLNRTELTGLLKEGNETTARQLKQLATQLVSYERVDLASLARTGPATAPAADANEPAAAGEIPAERVDKRVKELGKQLRDRLKLYADPMALITRQKAYSTAAAGESKKALDKAATATGKEKAELQDVGAGLKEWAAQADFQSVVIKYEELTKGKKAEEREKIEKEALADLAQVIKKWPGTAVLRQAYEFEIRKLIERGQTELAIDKIREFRQLYSEQADQLIKLVVYQIQQRIARLKSRLRNATLADEVNQARQELQRYQLAYVSFAETLYKAIEGKPINLVKLDEKIRSVESLEKVGDDAGLGKLAGEYPKLLAEYGVAAEDVKASRKVMTEVLESFSAASTPADKKKLLPDLAASVFNALSAVRDEVQERYALAQMYGDALIEKGRAQASQNQLHEARQSFQKALELFQKCRQADEERQELRRQWLESQYRPKITGLPQQARSMDRVRIFIDEFRKELVAQGEDPNKASDLDTLEFSYNFLKTAPNPEEERKRLPRTVRLLVRAWENHLKKLKTHVRVDPANVIGLAGSHRGLKEYEKALELYRTYVSGIDKAKYAKAFWLGQLARCRCRFEAGRESRDAMVSLQILIRQLEIVDRTMGGLAGEFGRLKVDIRERLKALPQRAAKAAALP